MTDGRAGAEVGRRSADEPRMLAPDDVERLKVRARGGDREALQQLREGGYFERKAAERQGFAASHAQRRLWVLDRMDDGSAAYNVPVALGLDGPLDVEALCRALALIVRRHESLRTALRDVGGEPRQFIDDAPAFAVARRDLRGEPDPEAAARTAAAAEAGRPFDLSRAPLVRATILQIGDERHVLLLTAHHVVFDQWSVEVFVRELAQGYRAYVAGLEPVLPEVAIQYKDFAAWQNNRLRGAEAEPLRQYWLRKLTGGMAPLDLPADRARPPVQTFRGAAVVRRLESHVGQHLETLGRREGASMVIVLAAVLKVLLHRYTGQSDIVIGTTTAGRDRRELADQIGFYVNALALRDHVDGVETFRAVLGRVRTTATEAYEHQAYPFDRLVDDLALPRDPSRSPLFDVMLVVNDDTMPELQLEGLRVSWFEHGLVAAKYDVTLDFIRVGEGWTFRLIYNTDLYDRRRMERFVDHFEQVAAGAAADPDGAIGRLALVGERERQSILSWSAGDTRVVPASRTIADLFEEQVARTPDAVAIQTPGVDGTATAVTYVELDARAARIAGRLDVPAGDETAVAVMAGRGAGLIAALVAVLKRGATYLPLDPALPVERLRFMARDAGATTVVTDGPNAVRARQLGLSDVIEITEAGELAGAALARHRAGRRVRSAAARAYVIYTSGSTGTPKGVEVEHRGFVNMITAQIDTFGLAASDVVLQFASCAFDASLSETFMALLSGASLVCPAEERLRDPAELLRLIKGARITVATLPPPYIRALGFDALRSLRVLITAGEAAEPDRGALAAGGCRYFNAYGPTECSVCATMGLVPAGAAPGEPVSIGRPVANSRVMILDAGGDIRPIGVPGEICVAGIGLARGYLAHPDLTSTSFPPDPWHPGARMYRTGDRGRWREDGTIEFLGRLDQQVKVRGYRIEPGEIETALRTQSGVRDAAVLLKDGGLVAYVETGDGDAAPTLREALAKSLPEYMVPDRIVVLAAFPRSTSGKIDRAALPAPEQRATEHTAPRSDVEAALVRIWQDVLGVEAIGVHDRFLDLGGHSMTAILMVSRVLRDLGIRLPIRDVFEHGTIAALARVLKAPQAAEKIPAVARAASYALSHGQRRLWTIDRMGEGAGAYNISGAIRLHGPFEAATLRRGLEALSARHESLRTTVVEIDGRPRQIVHEHLPIDFDVVEVGTPAGIGADARIRDLIETDVARPFDLAGGPPFRARLFRIEASASVFYLNIHHVVADGWSLEVFFRELVRLTSTGAPPELAPLAIQYKDFAAWQNAGIGGPPGAVHRAYWHTVLQGGVPVLDLPADRARPPVKSFRGSTVTWTLDADLSRRFHDVAREQQATSVAVWLSLLYALLHRYTEATDIIVGVPATYREHPDLEHQIGYFVNMVPLRVKVDAEESYAGLLGRIRAAIQDSFEHKSYPYDLLVEELALGRDMSRNPLFDVALSIQERTRAASNAAGPAASAFPFAGRTSKFDLTLFASETDDGRWAVVLEYDSDLFDHWRIERMAVHLQQLLRAAAASADAKVGDLEVMDAGERDDVCDRWNRTTRAYPRDAGLAALFRAAASRQPDDLAVECGDRRLTYRELDAASDRLAGAIVRMGPVPAVIPVLIGRSERVPIALLAVLKAGAAYSPIDAAAPPARVDVLLADLGATLVLAEPPHLADLSSRLPQLTCLDVDRAVDEARGPAAAGGGGSGDSLAYVMYTSGSTGRPKGVLVNQRAVTRLVCETDYVAFDRGDRVLHVSSLAFDASTFEIWGALLNGAAVCIPPAGEVPGGAEVREWLDRYRPTVLWLTASLFNQVAEFDAAMFRGVRTLLTGGERLSPAHVNLVRDACPGTVVVNGYGPTENTTFSICHRIDRRYESDIPLGRPIANSRAYVVDGRLRPVPVGVVGEILVAGDGIARGYLNDDALTDARFVPDPFVTGARAYRTGDRGFWRPDRTIAFVGRSDDQVKVRGYRVEPGEIEAALRSAGASEAVVVPRALATGTLELVAYVVRGPGLDPADLRERLRETLPSYMVPARVVPVDRMPLTPNGKVDKRRLPEPDHGTPAPAASTSTAREGALAKAWAAVLGRGEPGLDEAFFDLGGDSIQAIQIASRLRRDGWLLRVRDLFQQPTIRALAPMLQPVGGVDADAVVPPDAGGRTATLSPVQGWFFRQGEDLHHFNQSVLLDANAPVAEDCLRKVLRALSDRHAGLRATFRREAGTGMRSVIGPSGAEPELLLVDLTQSGDPVGDVERHGESVQRSFNVRSGPMWRAVLYRIGGEDRLFLCIHHLLVDVVSWRILLEDLETAYGQALRGEAINVGPATASYSDWAEGVAACARDGGFDAERAYWSRVDSARSVPLPYDMADEGPGTFGDAVTVEIGFEAADTTRLLERTYRAYGARVDELLLTALARAMWGFTGHPRLVVTTEGHGRDGDRLGLDVSRTVGWFTSLFPVVLDLSTVSVGDDIKRVKEAMRRVPGHGVGYGALRYLGPSTATQAAPAVSFNYLGQFDARPTSRARFVASSGPRGREIAADVPRTHHLDVSGAVAGGCLQLTIAYSARRFNPDTMDRLAERFRAEVLAMAAHCEAKALPEKTPADFTAAALTLDELAQVLRDTGLRGEDVDDVAHLSPMQEGLLYQRRLNPASSAYHVQMDFVIRGRFDAALYRRAWVELARRHPVLRTAFLDDGWPKPLQVVRREAPIEFTVEDLSSLQEPARTRRAIEYRSADLSRSFDMRHAPLWRIAVFTLAPDRHRIVWSYHHILIDGWSLAILHAQLSEVYAALESGRALAPVPERPFTAYVRWLERSDVDRARVYWSSYLAGLERRTIVPRRPAPPGEAGYAFSERTFEAGERVSTAIQQTAARLGVTTYTIVQTAWALVLSRYNGSDDVVFGSIVSGRPAALEHVEETVGLFINAVPVRVRLDRTRTCADIAQALQRDLLEQSDFHSLPLADIQRLAPLGRDLFTHLLVFENYPGVRDDAGAAAQGAAQAAESFEAHDESHYDLNLVVVPGRRFQFRTSYNTNVHPADWVERSIGHLFEAIEQVCARVDRPVAEIDVMTGAERAQLLDGFQGRRRSAPRLPSVVEQVSRHARQSPGAAAVQFGALAVTYAELDEQSDRFAAWLVDRWDIGADRRVAVLMDRSPRLIAALLGVLKAGGAYAPIDPACPRDRTAFLLDDMRAAVVLTGGPRASTVKGERTVCVDDIWPDAMSTGRRALASPDPSQLAYVIYTSGSTGRPKGCQIEHGNLAHYLEWAARAYFGEAPGGAFALYSSLAFDLTVTSLFLPLVRGRALRVLPQDIEVHDALREMLDPASGVDAIKLTPSHISLIPDLGLRGTGVSTAVVGGEALGLDHVRILRALNPRMAVFNEYGPTETTVGCVVKRIGPADETITIGKPIDDTRIHVLDDASRLAPIGVAGEMWIAGAGVGRGYLGQPALTRERFVDTPVGAAGARAEIRYRTGDVGRWLPDGDIEYLGRSDDQIKIRGHRIEPGEIEAAIAAATGGGDCVVMARRVGGRPEAVLVAYVIGAPDVTALRASLAASLPEAFVPAHVVVLDRLPLTVNGKVDRAALPDPEAAVVRERPEGRTPTERRVADIWQEVLGLEGVGREDKFFAVGGHSLKATQIVSRIIRQLGVKVSLREFFEDGTIAALAARIDGRTVTEPSGGIPVAPHQPDYVLSAAQHRLWLLHQLPGAEAAYNLPLALEVEGEDLDLAALQRAVDDLVNRHESLRTAFAVVDGEPRQRVLPSARVPLEVVDLREADPLTADDIARKTADERAHAPFDLATPPLMRVAVLRMPAAPPRQRAVLLLTLHHIVSDGWSMVVLTRELSALYRARRAGRPAALPPLRVQYKDFAEWQHRRDWSHSEAWWIDKLAGVPGHLALPYDREPGGERDFRGAVAEGVIDPVAADALRTLGSRRHATLAHVTLALFKLALYKLSGQADVCVGMSVANRDRADLEGLVGFFVNLVPIRTRLSEDMDLDELIDQVSRGVAEAGDRDCPFDAIVRRLGGQRLANRQPLINVVFAFQRFDDLRLESDGPDAGRAGGELIRPFQLEARTSKFDLTLFVADDGDGRPLKLVLEYDVGLFDAKTAEGMLEIFQRFASTVAGAGDEAGPA